MSALPLLKTSAKSWYSGGILERSGSDTEADLPETAGSEKDRLKLCAPGNRKARAKAAPLINDMCGDELPQALLPLNHDFAIFHRFNSSSCMRLP